MTPCFRSRVGPGVRLKRGILVATRKGSVHTLEGCLRSVSSSRVTNVGVPANIPLMCRLGRSFAISRMNCLNSRRVVHTGVSTMGVRSIHARRGGWVLQSGNDVIP